MTLRIKLAFHLLSSDNKAEYHKQADENPNSWDLREGSQLKVRSLVCGCLGRTSPGRFLGLRSVVCVVGRGTIGRGLRMLLLLLL
jgi:hypothetical protein